MSRAQEVIAAFKSEALIGVQIAFSSCWPIDVVPEEYALLFFRRRYHS